MYWVTEQVLYILSLILKFMLHQLTLNITILSYLPSALLESSFFPSKTASFSLRGWCHFKCGATAAQCY